MSQKDPNTTSVAKSSPKNAAPKGSGARSKGNFISRQVKATTKRPVTEDDLLKQQVVTPEDVLALETATEGEPKVVRYESMALGV